MAQFLVPDIATLRDTCQSGKVAHDSRAWYRLQRSVSIYLTWLLLHTGLTANHVTMISVAFALLGTALLATRPSWLALAGGACFLAHHLFDKVDGDIARFRKSYSIVGVYFDELGHSLAFAGIFAGLGLHLAWRATTAASVIAVLVAATIGALAMVLGRQQKSIGFLLFAQYALVQPGLVPPRAPGTLSAISRDAVHRSRKGSGGSGGFVARLRDLVLQLSDFSLMVVLLIAGAAIEAATGSDGTLRGLLFAEAALQSAVLVALVFVNATVNVESEVARLAARVRGSDDSEPTR